MAQALKGGEVDPVFSNLKSIKEGKGHRIFVPDNLKFNKLARNAFNSFNPGFLQL